MTFAKYSSIDNYYQTKHILRWLNEFPELENEEYVLQEKVDGANIQLYCEPGEKVQIGKRSSFLKEDESFYNIWDVVNRHEHVYEWIKEYAHKTQSPVRLYGELFGPGIQRRIKYNVEQPAFIFFDMIVGDHHLTPEELNVSQDDIPLVPQFARVKGLTNALNYSPDFKSFLSAEDNAEGFIIRPWNKNYVSKTGSRFIFKSKAEKFNEKMKVSPKVRKEIPARVLEAFNTFNSYLTDNRIDNIMGNYGPIEESKQLGEYIVYVLEDMKKDFLADGFDESKFDKDELKQIYNVGHKIVMLLKQRL